ncbi:disease resistance protein RPV1-like [Quercus suber]|uniref:disease resistance protein RPV1-like n=1 Tax=Quercus suber TaxID=58331 RepID=UPI0032DFDEA7
MFNLRFLMIDDLHIPNGLNHVSNSLRHLIWNGYFSKCLPCSFQPKELVKLELHSSNLEYLWKGVKYLDKLKSIDLSDSKFLIRTPDFSGLPRLERLYLIGCHNLVEIHPSIGQLRRLVVLDLESCGSLTNLPSMSTEMESLTILNLCDCINITNIPEFKGIMKSLSELSMNKTAIEELPSSIECLTALTSLNLGDCQNLECLPSNMDSLRSLEKLLLPGCLKLSALPENVWKMKCLKQLDLSGPGIRFRPGSSSFSVRRGLFSFSQNQLNFGGLFRLQRMGLNSIGFLSSLKYLTLSGNSLVTLPASISQLSKLEALDLSNCFKLQSLFLHLKFK